MTLPQLPAPEEAAVFVHCRGQQLGPMSRYEVQSRLIAAELGGDDSFWYQGMESWAVLGEHPELFADLATDPGATVAMAVPAMAEPPSLSASDDEEYDDIFCDLISASWDYLREHELASQIDEVFLGAVIAGSLDAGYSLIDLSSDGTHHFLRFENLDDASRMVFRLRHLTGDLATAKVLGQRASVVIGYGERFGDVGTVINALKAEFKSGFIENPEPGTITVDGDLKSGYIYAQVDMYWKIDDYVSTDLRVDSELLRIHITASKHALRKYLRGRFS